MLFRIAGKAQFKGSYRRSVQEGGLLCAQEQKYNRFIRISFVHSLNQQPYQEIILYKRRLLEQFRRMERLGSTYR